jgi:hypothetical protein
MPRPETPGTQRVYNLEAEKPKTVHDRVKAIDELWGHQLARIKQRAERRAREHIESPTPSNAGKDNHESGHR